MGFIVGGVVLDELGLLGDWCDLSWFDGFGGGGGVFVREFCVRVMFIVYE